jgi:hypothetical protein
MGCKLGCELGSKQSPGCLKPRRSPTGRSRGSWHTLRNLHELLTLANELNQREIHGANLEYTYIQVLSPLLFRERLAERNNRGFLVVICFLETFGRLLLPKVILLQQRMRFDLRRHQTCFEARFPDQPFKLRLRLPRTAPLFTTPFNSSLCIVDVGRTDTSVEELNKATSAPLLTNLSPALRCKGSFRNRQQRFQCPNLQALRRARAGWNCEYRICFADQFRNFVHRTRRRRFGTVRSWISCASF